MRHRLHLSALLAMSLIGATTSVFAQGTGPAAGAQIGTAPGTDGVPLVGTTPTNPGSPGISSVPGSLPTTTTTTGIGSGTSSDSSTNLNTGGMNPPDTGGMNQPGAPNTSVPGTIGTGASPSGLPGDDPGYPGLPARVGR
ncbi:MAG TPA: hypothetical protein VK522_08125 [Pseudolabrys sp.]|jgi:hypothetical protein|nr:hypothetical protein [Pseudolabrys sp.]